MAPESILDPASADARTDVYSLGAVAYYLLAGVDVFDGKSIVEVCSQHLHQAPQPLSARGLTVPADLEAVVLACLNKDPGRRPQSAAELRRRIDACSVEPWDSASALAWWREYQPDLDEDAVHSTGEAMTITVDGAYRPPAALAASATL
jgi:serine/threonine protein kinase